MRSTTVQMIDRRRIFPRIIQVVVIGLMIGLAVPSPRVLRAPAQPESTKFFGYFDFRFKSKDIKNLSQPWRYTWHNSGTLATVEQIRSYAPGKAKLVVHDGAGKQVYSRDLNEQGTFFTNPGVAGDWTIEVLFENEAH